MEISNKQLVEDLQHGDLFAFEKLYEKYYTFLCLIAGHIVKNPNDAEEIVSDVFVKLWNLREKPEIKTSIKAYLIRAVRNTSLNYLERNKISNKLSESINTADLQLLAWDSDYPLGQLYEKEVLEILDQGINKLPENCREIFLLSRNEDLKYSDIAEKQGISVNTVKTQMKIALSRLRDSLKDYLAILLILNLI
jgi:RNA polymerase sigma-70 factor (ECF subfamily)